MLPEFDIVTEIEHKYFLREAYRYAWEESTDRSTKNGAVIVNDEHQIIVYGTNGLPAHLLDKPEYHEAPLKYEHVKHAEKSAVEKADIDLEGLTMFCPWYACYDCAISISESGLSTVIGHEAMLLRTPERWTGEVKKGVEHLQSQGIETLLYRGEIGNVENLMDRKIWYP